MSTTTTPNPSSPLLSRLPKNKRRLFFILAAVMALLFAANSIGRAYHRYTLLHKDMMQAQILFSQYREQIDNRLNYNENVKLAQLEQAWALSEAKISDQQETIKRLEQALAQKSNHHSDLNLLQELKTQKEMYLQTQQKLQSYEQHILALTQELKASREHNQLIKQEQAKIREELIKKLGQNTPQTQISDEALEKALESRLSQFVYADYELEQKLKDLQKTVESAAKVGELKALEVYYDDKIDSLSDMIKSSGKKVLPQGQAQERKESSEVSQLKQELIKLHMEKEEMKNAVNNLWNQQRKSEERLNKLVETQVNQKKPSVEEQPQINRPTKVNNTPKTPQKEVNQKAQMKEQQELIDDFFKQFGIKSNIEVERPSQQQNHFNQRRVHPRLNNLNHHPQARTRHFNHDPFHQFSGFPRFNNFDPRINPIGMMDGVMFW